MHYSSYSSKPNNNDTLSKLFESIALNNFQKIEQHYSRNTTSTNQHHNVLDTANLFDITQGFNSNLLFFTSVTAISFTLMIHSNALNVFSGLKIKDYQNGKYLIKNVLVFVTLLCSLSAVFGYLSVPINTPTLIYNRYKLFNNDIFIEIGKKLLTFFFIFKIPILFSSLKHSIVGVIYNGKKNVLDKSTNFYVTVVFFTIVLMMCLTFKKIDDVLGVVSGVFTISYSMTFPMMLLYSYEYILLKTKLNSNNTEIDNYDNHYNILNPDDKVNGNVFENDDKALLKEAKENKEKAKKLIKPKRSQVWRNLFKKYGVMISLTICFASIGYFTTLLSIKKIIHGS